MKSTLVTSVLPKLKRCSGDPAKAKAVLGWSPKITFAQLVTEMVESDLAIAKRDSQMQQLGFKVLHHHE